MTKRLSRDLQTRINIDHVDFSLFNMMHLEGVLIEDREKDTLLYAGQVRVRITDWFFLKDKAELKYIGLEDAIIKFQRTDSIWRQQFFLDYFATPKKGAKKKGAGIEFDLKEVELKNVVFIKKDGWLGHDMVIRTGGMLLNANELSLSGKIYDIRSLHLKDPFVSLYNYPGRKPPTDRTVIPESLQPSEEPITDSVLFWNTGRLIVKIGELNIENGRFKNDRQTSRAAFVHFDGQHIDFTDINARLSNSTFIGDTVYSEMELSAKERSGLVVNKLNANVKFMPTGMAFEDLDLRTNRSNIGNFFMMSYKDMSDMDDYIHKVRMTANFDDSYIDSDDIAFFAPNIGSWNRRITLNGKVRGTVDDLVGRDLILEAGTSTVLNGDISLTGLPDIEQTFIDFKANEFRTIYRDAVAIVPQLREINYPDLRKIEYLHFNGSFTGFIRDFVTFGTITTNLGTVRSDLNMKLPYGRPPVYSGNISTDNFNLGSFLENPDLGYISMEGVVKGSGFTAVNRHAEVQGNIRYVDFKDYRYRNIVIDRARLDREQFDGSIAIRDENAELSLTGLIDFNKETPVFNFVADVKKANLQALKLTQNNLAFNGKFNLDFTGANIDDFLGTARISDAMLTKDGTPLPFDSLVLSSAYVNDQKILQARSNEFDAIIRGKFNIRELPSSFQLFLNKYYPSYINPPVRRPENQEITFDITTQFVEDYIKLIDTSLTGFNYSHVMGNLDTRASILNMEATIPYFKYKKYDFNDLSLNATGTLDSITLLGEARNIFINDSLNIPVVQFRISGSNDVSLVNIKTSANQTLNNANLNAIVRTYSDGVRIEFEQSNFVINAKTWTIDENGELEFRRNVPASGQLVLREGEQEIRIRTVPSANGSRYNDMVVDLQKINLGDLSPYLLPRNRLEGLLSGNVRIQDPINNLRIESENIRTEFLRIDNDSLGELNTKFVYDGKTQELVIEGSNPNQENHIEFNARLNLGDKAQQQNNIIALRPRNFQLKIIERFLGGLFSDIQGHVTGAFDIKGEFGNVYVVGKGRTKDAGLKVNFTQCFYKINDTDIELTPNSINLNGIVLTDPVSGNPLYLNGKIQHNAFKNMFYDVRVSTRKPNTTDPGNNRPVLLLNTSYKDNQQFYGTASGTGSFSLVGPQSDMIMAISAIASDRDTSTITIPPSRSRESGIADFLVERKYGREMDPGYSFNASNITYDLDVTANPMVTVKVVLDELTADEIKGKGRGTLNIHSGTNEPLRIRGRFDIEDGDYLFTFQSFFKKPFELKKGLNSNNYIEWSGDPYTAQINIEAQYVADRVSYAPLSALPGVEANIARIRTPVYVVAKLTGELFRPTINFDIDFPSSSPILTDPALSFAFQQLEDNKNEMYKQVTYLIVFNSFAPIEGSTSVGFSDIATNTISGIILGVINEQVNKILGKLLKNDKYTLNLNTTLYNRNVIDPTNNTALNLGSNVNFSIGRSFFNDRFVITVGGGLDAPFQTSVQESVQFLPDVTMEWLINPSGSLRASFFYRENAEYLTTSSDARRLKRIGGSLTYKKEFENLRDLFKRRPKPVTDTTTVAPASGTNGN